MQLSDIQFEYSLGNTRKARRQLEQYLRQHPNDVDAWELAEEWAETDADREQAEAGRRRAEAAGGGGSIWSSTSESTPAEPPSSWGSGSSSESGGTFPMGESSGSGGTFSMSSGGSGGIRVTSSSSANLSSDFLPHAIGVIVASLAGFGILGIILNVWFLNMARKSEEAGLNPENVGCLRATLIGQIALIAFGILVFFVAFVGVLMGG